MPEFNSNAYGNPNRGTSERELDRWNQAFRASPIYQNYMRRNGLPTDGRVKLSRDQQSALERELRAAGFNIPSGMHIDSGGNLNQKNRLVRNVAIGTAGTAAALTGFGLAGMGPFSGLAGGGAASGAAGAGGAGAAASGSLPATSWAVTPYAGTAAMAPTGAAAVGGSVGAGAAGSAIPGYVGGWEGNSDLLFGGGSGASGAGAASSLPAAYTPGWEGNSDIIGSSINAAADGARRYAGLTRDQWLKLATAVGGRAAGSLIGDRPDYSPSAVTNDPNMRRVLETMQGRLDKAEPLYDAVLAMSNGLLPTRYQRG